MGCPRLSSVSLGCLATLSFIICTCISQPQHHQQPHHPQQQQQQQQQQQHQQPQYHQQPHHQQPHHHQQQQQQQQKQPPNLTNELKIELVSRPSNCQRLSKKSDLLTIHYNGKLAATNVEFDNSRNHPEPFKFQLGAAAVIRGWEEGLQNMCVGEIRKLTVPPHMGYGDRVIERIPAKSTLLFEVELLNIENGEKIPNVFRLIDVNGDHLLSKDEVKTYIDTEAVRHGMQKDTNNIMLSDIFKQEDKNHDGFISHDEFSGPKHDEL